MLCASANSHGLIFHTQYEVEMLTNRSIWWRKPIKMVCIRLVFLFGLSLVSKIGEQTENHQYIKIVCIQKSIRTSAIFVEIVFFFACVNNGTAQYSLFVEVGFGGDSKKTHTKETK